MSKGIVSVHPFTQPYPFHKPSASCLSFKRIWQNHFCSTWQQKFWWRSVPLSFKKSCQHGVLKAIWKSLRTPCPQTKPFCWLQRNSRDIIRSRLSGLGSYKTSFMKPKMCWMNSSVKHWGDKWWKHMGTAPERYVAFFLALIHLYSTLRCVIKSKKSLSNS